MKKSKFLKKSLAMLLALMLVVAMIPLSAAAATPVLSDVQVAVNGSGQFSKLPVGEGANTYAGSIPNTATSVQLKVLAGSGNEVVYTDETTATPTEKKATGSNGVYTIDIRNLDEYTTDGVVSIEFAVVDASAPATRLEFTAQLTETAVSTDIGIEELTFERVITFGGKETVIPQLGETIIDKNTVTVTIPYDAADNTTLIRVRSLKLANGATATGISEGQDVTNVKEFTVTHNGNSQTYTLNIKPASGFTSFTTEEGLDAVMYPEAGKIAVLLPWGYTQDAINNGEDTITVTPVFDLDYETAEAEWDDKVMTSGETEITTSTDNVWGRNDYWTNPNNGHNMFGAFGNTSDNTDWADRKTAQQWSEFIDGMGTKNKTTAPEFTKKPGSYCEQVTIKYTENTSRTYDVYFIEAQRNNEAEITEFTIGSETAVIDQENKTIDITVPIGTDVTRLNSNNNNLDVTMTASNNATITIPMEDVTFTENNASNKSDRTPNVAFDTNSAFDGSEEDTIIRVISEDGLTEVDYKLNVTVSDEYVSPEITDMSLVSPDGKITVDGKPAKDNLGRNVYTFNVPYSVYDREELNGWKFFYTKTVGATASYNGPVANGGTVLPKSGSELTGLTDANVTTNTPYIPTVGDQSLGGLIYVNIQGQELSAEQTGYYIQINRMDPKTTSTLESLAIYGEPDFAAKDPDFWPTADLSTRFVYEGSLTGSTYTVEIPYSVYEQWDANDTNMPFYTLIEAAEDSNAKVYVEAVNGNLVPITNYGEEGTTTADWTQVFQPNVNAGNIPVIALYNGGKIVVLSEEAWVNLESQNKVLHGTYEGNIDGWYSLKNTEGVTNYTEYTVNFKPATANSETDLTSVRLVDGTGWTAPLSITKESENGGGRLYADIPYALTSDVSKDAAGNIVLGESINPVYLEYDVEDWAFVLGVNTGNTKTNGELDATSPEKISAAIDVPTAGNDGDGVFIDIADYLAMYDNNYDLALANYYKDNNPFFLIGRDGTVYIFNTTTDKNGYNNALVDDMIAVSSEDGRAYEQYTLDLTVKAANDGTEFSSFSFAEYPSRRGIVDNDNHTITVTLPYGSEYTYLTPVYTVSDGAIVTVDDPELQGKPLYNGYTDVNMSTTRKFTVIAENELDMVEYTVRVLVDERFSDVAPGAWYYDNVMDAAANEYVSGYEDGTFKPGNSVTRAEFASMIAKAMGYDDSLAGETRFKDVAADQWYAGAITFCADNGIISGYDDGTFQPGKTISRQEVASILKNAFNLTGNTGDLFPDDSAIAGWAKENVYAVKHSGLMKGYEEDGTFRPNGLMTRAEAASILMNANRAGLID